MSYNIEEIIESCSVIEAEIYEQTNELDYFNIQYRTNGYGHIVEFIGIEIWSSEEDTRKELDPNNEDIKESFEDCFRRRINEEIEKLKMIQL